MLGLPIEVSEDIPTQLLWSSLFIIVIIIIIILICTLQNNTM